MIIDEIIEQVEALGGVLTLQPGPGDGTPEISWGDAFFYYAPDGVVPNSQPFATIVTKDYPDDRTSQLDRPGAFRLNVAAGAAAVQALADHNPPPAAPDQEATPDPAPALEPDPSASDVVFAHPVYGSLGWLSVVNPGPRTADTVQHLLASSHERARSRYQRRQEVSTTPEQRDLTG